MLELPTALGFIVGGSRSTLGAFYTPPALTSRLFDMAEEASLNWKTARVLDPASGGGAVLFEAALRMRKSLFGQPASCLLVYSTAADVLHYASPGKVFGIDFFNETI
jgi:hypothetical protein